MQRVSSPSIFLSHLDIAKQLIAGAVDEDGIDAVLETIGQFDGGATSPEKLIAARAVSGMKSDATPATVCRGLDLSAFSSVRVAQSKGNSLSCFAVFNLAEQVEAIRDEIWSALDTGHVWGCEISAEVEKRLQTARERPSLARHLYRSATDHFVSDILNLLDELPGVFSIGPYGRVWFANLEADALGESISWITESRLTKFVSLLVIRAAERISDNDN